MNPLLPIEPVTLVGRTVRLEPMGEQHVHDLYEASDPSIWEFMLYGERKTEADIREWVLDVLSRKPRGDMPFAVIHLETGKAAGATRYMNVMPADRGLEIGGTWYGQQYQRTAVNTETKYLLLRHAFETLDCIRVQLKTDSLNFRSQKAIERIGGVKEGVLRNHMILPGGRRRDSVYYSMIDTEWPAVKQMLAEKLGYSDLSLP